MLSALSIIISLLLIQPIAVQLDPSFSLFANRGTGKIGITILVLAQIMWLLLTAPRTSWRKFITTNFSFFLSRTWFKTFFSFFLIFFTLHVVFVSLFLSTGAATPNTSCLFTLKPSLFLQIGFGFVATFFLAWTEELIFRGTVFPLINQQLSPIPSALIASFIFMAAHDLGNPLNLVTIHWRLGLGLFLLGFFLNFIYIVTKKLYASMGVHAGLVFVKVLLRRLPLLTFAPLSLMPWWLDKDLRQAPLAHGILLIACIGIILYNKKLFWKR
jgi:membrane protease YdiL (CAAX protease family)